MELMMWRDDRSSKSGASGSFFETKVRPLQSQPGNSALEPISLTIDVEKLNSKNDMTALAWSRHG
jgi:hypothetical protein